MTSTTTTMTELVVEAEIVGTFIVLHNVPNMKNT